MESNSAFCVSVWPGPHKVWLEGGGWEEGKELCDPWFYSKSDIVGLSAGDLCPCIVNNCYYIFGNDITNGAFVDIADPNKAVKFLKDFGMEG